MAATFSIVVWQTGKRLSEFLKAAFRASVSEKRSGSQLDKGDNVSNLETAKAFMDACDGGQGWDTCKQWCHDSASFSCPADALAEIQSVEDYTGWAAGLLTPIPDASYDLYAAAEDADSGRVMLFGVFKGHQTGEGGPVPATGNAIASDYLYTLDFNDSKISHIQKIWNDGHALKQLGWA